MWIYLSLLVLPSLYSVINFKNNKNKSIIFCLSFSLLLILILGLRNKVGGDWINYLFIYENINKYFNPISLDFLESDYLYDLINWVAYNYSFGFVFVNLINTII